MDFKYWRQRIGCIRMEYSTFKTRGDFTEYGPDSPINVTLKRLFDEDPGLLSPDKSAVNMCFLDSIYQTRLSAQWDKGSKTNLWDFFLRLVSEHREELYKLIVGSQISNLRSKKDVMKAQKNLQCLATWTNKRIVQYDGRKRGKNSVGPNSFWTKFLVFHSGQSIIFDKYSRLGVNSIFCPNQQSLCDCEQFFDHAPRIYCWIFPDGVLNFHRAKYFDAYLVKRGRAHGDVVDKRKKPRRTDSPP